MGAIATPLKKLRSSPNWTKDGRFRSTEPLSPSQQQGKKKKDFLILVRRRKIVLLFRGGKEI